MKAIVKETESQSERFKRAARELGCDESEERFVEAVRKIAKAGPRPKPRKGARSSIRKA